jgi:hypothetical protein
MDDLQRAEVAKIVRLLHELSAQTEPLNRTQRDILRVCAQYLEKDLK